MALGRTFLLPMSIDSIENTIDQNKFACGVYLKFKKAFDIVDHKILSIKL